MDGRNIKTKFHHNGDINTLVEFQMSDGVNTTLTRQFFADRMEVYMNVNAVNASSLFRRNTSWIPTFPRLMWEKKNYLQK